MDPHGDVIGAAERSRRRGLAAQRVWYVTLSVLFGMLIIAGLVSALAVRPEYCTLCHQDQYVGLRTSRHADLTCDTCHTTGDVFGVLDSRLAIVAMLPARLGVGAPVSPGAVESRACKECHSAAIARTVMVDGLRMSHREVTEAGWSCVTCHARAAHGSAATYDSGYTMDMCLTCHRPDAKDIATCEKCHAEGSYPQVTRGRTPWRVTHGANWQRMHGMGDLRTCMSCHPADYCVQCHKMALPHPPTFKNTHGRAVLERASGRRDCVVCHKGTACDDCHGLTMPHPAGFIRTHSQTVKADGEQVCMRCHDKVSCSKCHERHIHPGIPTDQLKLLQERPVN
jgi:hypothetical protein